MIKFLLYLIVMPLTVYAMDSVNINGVFKKNKIYQARILYILIIFALSYLITNFLYDFMYMLDK